MASVVKPDSKQPSLKRFMVAIVYCPNCNEEIWVPSDDYQITNEVKCPKCNFTGAGVAFSWSPITMEPPKKEIKLNTGGIGGITLDKSGFTTMTQKFQNKKIVD